MQYMYIVSSATNAPPTPELLAEMDKMAQRAVEAGTLVSMGGLLPLDMGARIRLKSGKVSVHDGPFSEAKEVVGGFAIFDYATREEAIASATEFMECHAKYAPGWEGVCEMRPMADPHDG